MCRTRQRRRNANRFVLRGAILHRVVGFGWNYPFGERGWADVHESLSGVRWRTDDDKYPLAIIDSVLRCGADEVLAIRTSMHDLVVAPRPATDPPMDVVIVCAPGSMRKHPPNTIRVDLQTVVGKHTEIVRPTSEAVALFWRTVETAFGVRPASEPRVTIVHTRRGVLLTKDEYRDWREVQDHVDDYMASLGPTPMTNCSTTWRSSTRRTLLFRRDESPSFYESPSDISGRCERCLAGALGGREVLAVPERQQHRASPGVGRVEAGWLLGEVVRPLGRWSLA
jgi:hypothetical protein